MLCENYHRTTNNSKQNQANRTSSWTKSCRIARWIFMRDEISVHSGGHWVQKQGLNCIIIDIYIWCFWSIGMYRWGTLACVDVYLISLSSRLLKYPSGVYSSYSIYSSSVLLKSWRIQHRRIREYQTSMKCHGMLYNGPQKLSLGRSLECWWEIDCHFRGKGNVWMVLKCSVVFQRRVFFEKLN